MNTFREQVEDDRRFWTAVFDLCMTDEDRANLQPLKISKPPDWEEYHEYLLDGGSLDYDEWQAAKDAADYQAMTKAIGKGGVK